MCKKYSIDIIIIGKFIFFLILLVFLSNFLAIITYIFVAKTVYPAIVFLFSLLGIYFILHTNFKKNIEISCNNDHILIDNVEYLLSDLKSYSFKETDYIGTVKLNFNSKRVKLYIRLKKKSKYLEFKNDMLKVIAEFNKCNNYHIIEFDWYKTRFAKFYGYLNIIILTVWSILIILNYEKTKLSYLIFFVLVVIGLLPILMKIFNERGDE